LLSLVVRLSLPYERGHALFGIVALEKLDEQLALELQPFIESHAEALHRSLLDAPDRKRRTGPVRAKSFEGLVEKLRRGYHLIHDPRGQRVLWPHRRTAQHALEASIAPDAS